MRTYVCDICGERLSNPIKQVFMRELIAKDKPLKKEKIHICSECWGEIKRKVLDRRQFYATLQLQMAPKNESKEI